MCENVGVNNSQNVKAWKGSASTHSTWIVLGWHSSYRLQDRSTYNQQGPAQIAVIRAWKLWAAESEGDVCDSPPSSGRCWRRNGSISSGIQKRKRHSTHPSVHIHWKEASNGLRDPCSAPQFDESVGGGQAEGRRDGSSTYRQRGRRKTVRQKLDGGRKDSHRRSQLELLMFNWLWNICEPIWSC